MAISLIYNHSPEKNCFSDLTTSLFDLTHSGQESHWFAVCDGKNMRSVKNNGTVDILQQENLFKGFAGIGANSAEINSVPNVSYCSNLRNFSIAFDGYLINGDKLRERYGGDTDGEVAARFIADANEFVGGIKNFSEEAIGSYNVVGVTEKGEAYATRSHLGTWPLVYGKNDQGFGIVTESRALDHINMNLVRDIDPGEIVEVDGSGIHTLHSPKNHVTKICSFLWAYYGMADSIFQKIPVYLARRRIAKLLCAKDAGKLDVDFVTGIPNSGNMYAQFYAIEAGKPHITVLPKYEYAGRSYDRNRQEIRDKVAHVKLNVIKGVVKGKKIKVLDDSIRRGTQLIKPRGPLGLLKSADAKEINLSLGSPRNIRYCRLKAPDAGEYRDDHLAANRFPSDEQLSDYLGIQNVSFPEVDEFVACIVEGGELKPEELCLGCYTGSFDFLKGFKTFEA